MKRFLALLLAAAMLFSLCACGKKPTDITIEVDGDDVSKLELPLDSEVELKAVLSPAGAQGDILWESSDEDVATVEDGELILVGEGSAKITATCGDLKDKLKLTVVAAENPKEEEAEAGVEAVEEAAPAEEVPAGDVYVYPVRTPVAFSDMEFTYDAETFAAAVADMNARSGDASALEDLKDDFDAICDQFDNAATDFALLEIAYQSNPADEDAFSAYNDFSLELEQISDDMCNAVQAALRGPCGAELESYINSDKVVDDIMRHIPLTEEELALTEENNALTDEYYSMAAEAGTTSQEMGELYLLLIDNMIADAAFHPEAKDAVDYYYTYVYMRDFAPAETETLYKWVREEGVPLTISCLLSIYGYTDQMNAFFDPENAPSEGEMIDRVLPYISTVSEEAADIFNTMVELGLYDLAASPDKAEAGFTIDLISYGVPFIFNCPYGYMQDYETLVHESGHFYEAFVNDEPQLYQYDCMDLCEIDSQGMETLMLRYADEIYGEGMGDFVRVLTMYNLLNAIVDGCVQDCFQQRAFAMRASGELQTGQDVVDLYLEVEEEFWGDYAADFGWGENWWQIHHNFDCPFYYISYATSATAALGILAMSSQDYDGTLKMYDELIHMGNAQGFEYTLEKCGLPNPLSEAGIEQMNNLLASYVGELIDSDYLAMFGLAA